MNSQVSYTPKAQKQFRSIEWADINRNRIGFYEFLYKTAKINFHFSPSDWIRLKCYNDFMEGMFQLSFTLVFNHIVVQLSFYNFDFYWSSSINYVKFTNADDAFGFIHIYRFLLIWGFYFSNLE